MQTAQKPEFAQYLIQIGRKDLAIAGGILPPPKSFGAPYTYKEKSIGKYPDYQNRKYIDIKNRLRGEWNLVGQGDYYPTKFDENGKLLKAGCGWLWKDEGLGCKNIAGHKGHKKAHGKMVIKLMAHTCLRPQCPICYQKWATKQAYTIEERFIRVPKLERWKNKEKNKAEARTKYGKPIHLVISVPEKDSQLMYTDYKELKRIVTEQAKYVGFRAGVMIFHPFANDELDKDKKNIEIEVKNGEFDTQALQEYYEKQGKYIRFWYERPHFHFIGYGWIKKHRVKINHNRTRYIVKNLGVRQSVINTAHYQLSHAGYRKGSHTTAWIGLMSNRTFKKIALPELERQPKLCPVCEEPMKPYKWLPDIPEKERPPPPTCYQYKEGTYYVNPSGWIEQKQLRPRMVFPHK
jgi:hypothetical protein